MFWNVSDIKRPDVEQMIDSINRYMMGKCPVISHNPWTKTEKLRLKLDFGTAMNLKITSLQMSPRTSRIRIEIRSPNFKLRYEGYDDRMLFLKHQPPPLLFVEDRLWLRGLKGEDEYMAFLLALL